jgi:predicted Zn-dependent peptidase
MTSPLKTVFGGDLVTDEKDLAKDMILKTKLSNGVTVVTEELAHAESSAIGVWVRAGAVDEIQPSATENGNFKKINAGISHFIEHMMFKGTENRSYMDIAYDIDKIGANANAFTGREATCYYVKLLPQHMAYCIEILADMLTGSLFDSEEMEKEKKVIYEEMKMIEDVPEDLGHELIDETVFKGGSLGNRIIGTPDSVGAVTRGDILAYLAERYTAENMLISVSGKFDRENLLVLLEEKFGGVSSGNGAVRVHKDVAHTPTEIVKDKGIAQSHLYLGKRSVKRLDPDYYAYQLYSSLLGGSMSSRLFQNVREDKGLAYSVYSQNSSVANDGMFIVYAAVAHEKRDAAIDAVLEELMKLAETEVDQEELQKVKEQTKGGYLFARESIVGRMSSIGMNLLLLDRIVDPEDVMRAIDAVTPEDIRRIAAQNADKSQYSSVIVK